MSKKSLNDHQKDMVYQLCEVDHIPQSKVATMYGVSQPTVSNAIKDKKHEQEVMHLKNTLQNAAAYGFQAAAEDGLITQEIPRLKSDN